MQLAQGDERRSTAFKMVPRQVEVHERSALAQGVRELDASNVGDFTFSEAQSDKLRRESVVQQRVFQVFASALSDA